MLVSIFQLIGVLIGGIGACGILIAGTKLVGRRFLGWGAAGGSMVTLGIDGEERG
jgi:hypothetical protein